MTARRSVNGSPDARAADTAMADAREGMRLLGEAGDVENARTSTIRAATMAALGRVLHHGEGAVVDEARRALDRLQLGALERSLAPWLPVLVEHGFLAGLPDDESVRVLVSARLEGLRVEQRWSMHREHGRPS